MSKDNKPRLKQFAKFIGATAFTILATRYTHRQIISKKCMFY